MMIRSLILVSLVCLVIPIPAFGQDLSRQFTASLNRVRANCDCGPECDCGCEVTGICTCAARGMVKVRDANGCRMVPASSLAQQPKATITESRTTSTGQRFLANTSDVQHYQATEVVGQYATINGEKCFLHDGKYFPVTQWSPAAVQSAFPLQRTPVPYQVPVIQAPAYRIPVSYYQAPSYRILSQGPGAVCST